jgi:hypothetical protein
MSHTCGIRVHKNGLVRPAFGRQFTSADRNWRVQAQPSNPSQQARAPDVDVGSRGDVVAVVLEVGTYMPCQCSLSSQLAGDSAGQGPAACARGTHDRTNQGIGGNQTPNNWM